MALPHNHVTAEATSLENGPAHPRRWLWLIPFGLALHLPTLGMGFLTDDYAHQIILQGVEHPTLRPWSLYDFGGVPDPDEPGWQFGSFPWWTSPDWKIRFFRPLTSLTLWLDHVLFGRWAMGYHLTNLAWFAGLLILMHGLCRSLELPSRACTLALFFFAASTSCLFPVSWPANRNTLIAVFFMVASIRVLSLPRSRGRPAPLVAALVLAILASLAKETGVTAFGLIVAYLWWLRRRADVSVPQRWVMTGSIGSLLLAGLYGAFLLSRGYGTNCVFYAMPWSDPILFLRNLGELVTKGGLSLVGPFSVDAIIFVPHGGLICVIVFFALIVPFAWFLWRQVRAHPGAGFLAAWTLITVVPQGGAPPSDRLLFAASVGSSGLLALFVCATVFPGQTAPRRRGRRMLGFVIFFSAGVASALSLVAQGISGAQFVGEVRDAILTADVGPVVAGRREVFVFQSPNMLVPLGMLPTWAVETNDPNVRFWPMQTGRRGLRWTRLDERTFDLTSLGRPFLTDLLERLFLTRRGLPTPGATWKTALFTVVAIDVDENGLHRFRVHCPESLDTPGYRFLIVRDGRFVHTAPPAVGETVIIPPAIPPRPFVP